MNSIKTLVQHAGYVGVAFAMLASLLVPVIASAAQVTERSISLSSSSVSATGVVYKVNFTSVGAAGAFVVEFCSDTPLVGQACTAPAGFSASSAASTTSGFTDVTGATNKFTVAGTIAATTAIEVDVTGITNPSTTGALYARIVTYDTKANALLYESEDLGSGNVDDGGLAISITPTIGVSGTVLETLTFCVSEAAITDNCVTTTPPVVELGEQVGDVVALTPGVLSEDSMFTQISTNASGGAVVRLKSNALNCGGLMRAGAPSACDILPALNSGINPAANEAKFGVKTATATSTTGQEATANGTLAPADGSFYNNTTYALNYIAGNGTGVTSPFGDPFLDTADAPVTSKNMELTFGASVSNNTPAGAYSADLSMIAVGKF